MQSGSQVCFSSFNCLFGLEVESQGFFCRGTSFTMPVDQAARCETHAILTRIVMPHNFRSHSEIRSGQSHKVWQLLFLFLLWFLQASYVLFSYCFSSLWSTSMSISRNPLYHEASGCCCWWLVFDSWYHQLLPAPDLSAFMPCDFCLGWELSISPVTLNCQGNNVCLDLRIYNQAWGFFLEFSLTQFTRITSQICEICTSSKFSAKFTFMHVGPLIRGSKKIGFRGSLNFWKLYALFCVDVCMGAFCGE